MFLKVYKHVFTRVRLCSSKKNHDSITQIALMLIWILLEYRVNSAKNHVFGLPFENGPIFHFKNHDSILLICPITRISHCSILFNYFFEIIIPMRGVWVKNGEKWWIYKNVSRIVKNIRSTVVPTTYVLYFSKDCFDF